MKKVLFSTTWGPFQEQFFNTSPTDVMNQRFSRGCDIFSMNGHLHVNFAHLIAQNIELPSVFLEYPEREDFIEEVDKGYDYVAISSFHNQVDDLIEMCKLVRQRAPQSKIVIGGWGAVGVEATFPEEERSKLCDYLCHEEGIRCFRRILGEEPDRPMFHSHLPKWGYSLPMINRHPPGATPVVVASVGCPNGCDFCATTEMFKGCRIPLMTPEQVYMELKRAWQEDPNTPQATILEEDSFQDKEYMTELGRLLREDTEFGLASFNFYCLASIGSMSRWSFEEMMLTGCSNVFVGVESKFARDHGYHKISGLTTREMFDGLHNVGIATTGAWMLGFDFQDRDNIEEDLQEFVDLCPTLQQLTRVCPFPGTPMWDRMKEEGRIREDTRWEEISFYGGGGMKLKNFKEHEVMELIERGYRQLYETHGASIARMADVNMQGYEYCIQNHRRNKYLDDRAVFHKRIVYTIYPLMKAMEIYAPNNIVRKKMKDLRRRYLRLIGKPTSFQQSMEKVVTGAAGMNKLMDILYPFDNVLKEEPFKKYIYDKPAPVWPERPYRVEYPHRTWRYSLNEQTRRNIRRLLAGADRISMMIPDRVRGIQYDEAMRRGPFSFFL